eukprot:TRINITY_DN39637_c0_g1_i1.p1 TRINITY_DN39637_c0_g1~~TRINITY_DN39637_c0_g1_i1.p1  ORF type:complete len:1718 (-),score=265.09 TRINITY_DN39637_c0_g1_i1:109-5262(-)
MPKHAADRSVALRRKYVIGFTVHEAKELARDGVAVDPLVVTRCLDNEHTTDVKTGKLQHVKFEESYIWSDSLLTDDEFNIATIDFELQAANSFFRNTILGQGKVQLAMVRQRPNHAYVKKYLQLTLSTQNTARLQVTVFCYGEGDTPPRPEDIENDPLDVAAQLEDLNNAVLAEKKGRGEEQKQAYHLFVHVHRAEHLGGGTEIFNPFVSIQFNGIERRSEVCRDVHTVNFDECVRIPVCTPLFTDSIVIRVWDKGAWSPDKIIVQGRLSFSSLRMHAMAPKWFMFYGFDAKEVGDVDALLDSGEKPEENYYLGRLLVSGRVQKLKSVHELLDGASVKGQIYHEPPTSGITLVLDVYEVAGCPGSECFVQISVGKKSKQTKLAERTGNNDSSINGKFCFTDGRGRVPALDVLMAADQENQLDVILSIYSNLPGTLALSSGLQRVGFCRIKICDIAHFEKEASVPTWVVCKPMAHLPSSIEPGQVLCSLRIATEHVEERGMPCLKEVDFELRSYILKGRDLKTQHTDSPSAYAQVSCAGVTARTKTVANTAGPVWCEVLKLDIKLMASLTTERVFPEPIYIQVFDDIQAKEGDFTDVFGQGEKEQAAGAAGGALKKLNKKLWRQAQQAQDGALAMVGNVMAKKRYGAVQSGRQLMGRTIVKFSRLLRPPPAEGSMRPKWVKLKGGLLGDGASGDILIGFQLLKKKYVKQLPAESPAPEGRAVMLCLSVLGLRDVAVPPGMTFNSPMVRFVVPQESKGDLVISDLIWSRIPIDPLGPDDENSWWTCNGKVGAEFLRVVNLDVDLPTKPIWEPSLRIRLYGDGGDKEFIGEGIYSLIPHLGSKKKKRVETAASETFQLDSSECEVEDDDQGLPCSDIEGHSSPYHTVTFEKDAVNLAFNADDSTTYPPTVTWLDDKSAATEKGVKVGDWLVGYQTPTDGKEKPCAHWNSAQAATFVEKMDSQRVRPLKLRFRTKDRDEISVRIHKGNASLKLKDSEDTPPCIEKDTSKDKMWKGAGIQLGWKVVDINGFSTEELSANNANFKKLMDLRPAIFTCRAFGRHEGGGPAAEKKLQDASPVRLSGMPTKLFEETAKRLRGHKDTKHLKHTRCPHPTAEIMPVDDAKHMVLRVARNAFVDVRGVIKQALIGQKVDEDADESRQRPMVPGPLEEYMPEPTFAPVSLMSGKKKVGVFKVKVEVQQIGKTDWFKSKKLKDTMTADIFDPSRFRRKFKLELPQVLRVRTYIIRGLNVSGATSGYGNPFLYFIYGHETAFLDGKKCMATVEPRFFHTEERDITLPDQSLFEVGLQDWSENGDHQLIGKTFIDLEDRWYTELYQEFMKKGVVPLEYRSLEALGDGALSKGSLEMWVEIIDATRAADIQVSPLVQPPAVEIEIRVIVFTCRDVSRRLCVDEIGEERKTIELMCKCALECRAYQGPQPVVQETDIHYGMVDEAEFNWRFIWSRLQVTRGVPLDCFVQISLWEQFAIARPVLLCESLLEVKNYCKKVATSSTMLQIEAEIPLTNASLTKLLKDELEESGMATDDGENVQVPPAAIVKTMVQVFNQTEAMSKDMKAGMGRNEPNTNPGLPFPKTGRSWQATLPGAAKFIDSISAMGGGSGGRCGMMSTLFLGVMAYMAAVSVDNPNQPGCKLAYKSCVVTCPNCMTCQASTASASAFCYLLTQSAEASCLPASSSSIITASCQIATSVTSCAAPSDGSSPCVSSS